MTSAQMRKQKVYVRANGTGVHEGGDSAQGHSRLSMRIQVSNAVEEVDDAPEGDEDDYGDLGDLAEVSEAWAVLSSAACRCDLLTVILSVAVNLLACRLRGPA